MLWTTFWANKNPHITQKEVFFRLLASSNYMSSWIQGDGNNPVGWVCSYFTSDFHWSGTLVCMPSW